VLTDALTARPGAVMTDEAGVVTGALELRSARGADGTAEVHVRYEGALDWYRLSGTAGLAVPDDAALEAVHRALVAVLAAT
jgi:hypothetical protein